MNPSQQAFPAAIGAIYREEAEDLLGRAGGVLNALSSAANDDVGGHLREIMRLLHTLKGSAAAVGEMAMKEAAHVLEEKVAEWQTQSMPPLQLVERLEPEWRHLGALLTANAPAPDAAADTSVRVVAEGPTRGSDYVRVPPHRIDLLHALVDDLIVGRLQQDALSGRLGSLGQEAAETANLAKALLVQVRIVRKALGEKSFSTLWSAGQQLQHKLGILHAESASVAREAVLLQAKSGVVAAEIEAGVRDLRLMPIEPFFESFVPSIRDAARDAGRSVRLEIAAEGAAVDRAVLTRLREPLLHLVRNAVVHGLEPAEERARRAKPLEGVLRLEASAAGAHAVMRVIDDGAGVDRARVREKAVAKGLWRDDASVENDDVLLELLTTPGFSTRDSADGLSGRGVGLDVVADTLRDLGGKLDMFSAAGAGTVFTLTVPIAASTGLGLLLRVGERVFGVLLGGVEKVVRLAPDDLARIEGRDVATISGESLGLAALSVLLRLENDPVAQQKRSAVVLRSGKRKLVLVVDEVPGEQTMVIKPLPRAFSRAGVFSGCAIQADGSIIPVLDVPALFERAAQSTEPLMPDAPAAAPKSKRSVLVADDSITMRTLLRNVLRGDGYEVTVTHDGAAALAELSREGAAYVLLVTDLQMPRLDGVGLSRAVRSGPTPNLPIIMVTSVDAAEEKAKALEAGADAYFVKSNFDQKRFLDMARQLASA